MSRAQAQVIVVAELRLFLRPGRRGGRCRRRGSCSMCTWARWRAGCGWSAWTPPTPMTPPMMRSSSRPTPGGVLLTQDRGLLRRRKLWLGAYVRGARPDEQFADVLDRFAPPLAPWTGCTACNGLLAAARKADVEALLRPGTRRSYQAFSRCAGCGRVYWRGAHSKRLEVIVESAVRAVSAADSRHDQ